MEPDHAKTSSTNLKFEQAFSEEDQERYQDIFSHEAQQDRLMWRKSISIILISFIVYYLIGLTISDYPIANALWIIGLFVIPAPAIILVIISSKELKCPACRKKLFRSGEHGCNYCPECGAEGIKFKGWITCHYCESCCKKFVEYRYSRNYKIRFCTYCGLFFSKKGY